jgi:hypothetical protein
MAWFESGRAATAVYQFTLTAHHARPAPFPPSPGHPDCQGVATAAGPGWLAELISKVENPGGAADFYLFTLRIRFEHLSSPFSRIYTSTVRTYPYPFDETVSATITISIPCRERKEVRVPSPPGTPYDWLPPDVELQYALHPQPDTEIEVVIESSEPNFEQEFSLDTVGTNAARDLAPWMTLGVQTRELGTAKDFTGLIAEVTDVSCSLADLNFNDGGEPSSGFNASANNALLYTGADSLHLELTSIEGVTGADAITTVYPVHKWAYDGKVNVFNTAYKGTPVIHDHNTDEDYPAPNARFRQSFAHRRFTWSWALWDEDDAIAVNEHHNIKAELQEEWTEDNGEEVDDRRLLLEDDEIWNAFRMSRAPVLTLEDLNSIAGWDFDGGSEGVISGFTPGAIQVRTVTENAAIIKEVEHNLGTYRYLRFDLKVDHELTPVRLHLGEYFWDVAVEKANRWESVTLDLAAPHNAETFEDVEGLHAIETIKIDALWPPFAYYLRDLRLLRSAVDHIHVLPPFQGDGLIFHRSDRRPGLSVPFRSGGGQQSLQDVVDAISARVDSGFSAVTYASEHPYYNPDAYAAFLHDQMEFEITGEIRFAAQIKADKIVPWVGMGNPTDSLPSYGTLTARFTKCLHGLLDGIVYIRDVPGNSAQTRVAIKQDDSNVSILRTDVRFRAYRSSGQQLKPGTYVIVRLDQKDREWMRGTQEVVNRAYVHQHLRAQIVSEFDSEETPEPVQDTEVNADLGVALTDGIVDYSRVDAMSAKTTAGSQGGFYAVPNLEPVPHDAGADAPTSDRLTHLAMLGQQIPTVQPAVAPALPRRTHHIDTALIKKQSGRMLGTIVEAETSEPIDEADVVTDATEAPWLGGDTDLTDIEGVFHFLELNATTTKNQSRGLYDVWTRFAGRSVKRLKGVIVSPGNPPTDIGNLGLDLKGSISGTVTQGGAPLLNARVFASQTDGSQIGFGNGSTDSSGNYSITGLEAPGYYEMIVWTPSPRRDWVRSKVHLAAGESKDQDFGF